MTALTTQVTEALAVHRLEIEPGDAGIKVAYGRFRARKEATFTLDALQAHLDANPDAPREAVLASFASGVSAVIKQPEHRRFDTWAFTDAAGRILALLVRDAWVLGVAAAGIQDPWMQPFTAGLQIAYTIDVDQGRRVLTHAQVDRWAVTEDRVTCAARSLLFHKTRYGGFDAVREGLPERYNIGDGQDAARALILPDLDYHAARKGLVFAAPHPNLLLLHTPPRPNTPAADGADAALSAFAADVDDAFAKANQPLSRDLFVFEDGKTPRVLPRPT